MADLSSELLKGKSAAFQYKPVESRELSWLSMTENQRNFLESEAKRKEQQDLRDQLVKVQQLGLPKEMQGYLNSNVQNLIEQVRSGEIDPNSYDFRSKIAIISGEGAQLFAINENLKTLSTEDKMVMGRDENGDPIDLSNQLKREYFSGFDTDYQDGTDVYGKYSAIQSKLNSALKPITFDDKSVSVLTDEWIKRNAETNKTIQGLTQQGYTGYDLITELQKIDPSLIEDYKKSLDAASDVSLQMEYAKAKDIASRTGATISDYNTYKQQRLSPYTPRPVRVTDQTFDTTRFEQEEATKRAQMRQSPTPTTFEFGGGAFSSTFDPATGKVKQVQYFGLDPTTLTDASGNSVTVLGITVVDGKRVAVTSEGVVPNSSDLAEQYNNRQKAKLGDDEKIAYDKKLEEMMLGQNVVENEPDPVKVQSLDELIKSFSGVNDDEEGLIKELVNIYNLDKANPQTRTFLFDLTKFAKKNENNFATEKGRKAIINKILEFPQMTSKFAQPFDFTNSSEEPFDAEKFYKERKAKN